MRTSIKVKKRIEEEFGKLLKEYPMIDSLSCDIAVCNEEKQFIFKCRGDE